jgi:beta-glucosidase
MLLAKMTLADKIALVHGQAGTSPAGAIGAVPANPSLCIPAISEQDGPAGVGDGATGVTQLPAPVDLASTWDPALAKDYGTVIGAEEHGKGMEVVYGPAINIQRDPRWGRNYEMLSEDPYLVGQMAAPEVEGIQSQDVIAELKHFAVYNQETYRNTPADDAIVSEQALHEIYLPAWNYVTTAAKPGAVMCSYATVNDEYACQNKYLLQTLEQRWGYKGFVGSDYGATHSTVASANAGLDQEMPGSTYFGAALEAAVESGQVTMATLDGMVSRILTQMFDFGFFNQEPTGKINTPVTTPGHAAVALQVAEDGTVLLKNADGILPLTSTASSIAVLGPNAGPDPLTAGGGSAHVIAPFKVSPVPAITAAAPAGVTVTSYTGTDATTAAAVAAAAHVAVVFADNYESEGSDLPNITLQDNQDAYISAVAAANPNTIVVLNTGGPVTMPWINQVKGVLEAWYPGEEDGTAIASVLFGSVDPGGHLAETFPVSLSQAPTAPPADFPGTNGQVLYSPPGSDNGLLVGYRYYSTDNVTPLFPFGYGLSYTSFAFSDLTVTPTRVDNTSSTPGETSCDCNGQGTDLVNVTARVTNTGKVAGSDVAQLYLGEPASASQPARQLEGFEKVFLGPGQSTMVHFELNGHALSYWDDTANGWVLPDGAFSVYVGDSSALANLPLRGTFTVVKSLGARYATLSAPSTVDPQATFTATAQFVNDGDYPMNGTQFSLQVPQGWTVQTAPVAPKVVPAGGSVTVTFQVTAPAGAQASTATLTAEARFAPAPPGPPPNPPGVPARFGPPPLPPGQQSRLVEATATVSVAPLATGTLTPTSVTLGPGNSAAVTLAISSNISHQQTVDYNATPPSGISVVPAQGTLQVPPTGASTALTVSVAAGTPGGLYTVPISLTATAGTVGPPSAPTGGSPPPSPPVPLGPGQQYELGGLILQVSVPFTSLSAAFNNVGITSDNDTTPGNYDGVGDSFSAQNLTAAGLAPGATVYQDGTLLTWPNVPAGEPDNVVAEGQTIDLTGTGTTLELLGASAYGASTGTLTVNYADGTSQTATVSFNDWYDNAPVTGGNLVAQTTNWNPATTPAQPVSVYSWAVSLEAGKQVSSVTLPDISSGVGSGITAMHVFAMGLGSGSSSVPFSSLQEAYNNVGVSDASDPSKANYDGNGDSFQAEALASGTPDTLVPGGTVVEDGATLTWPDVVSGQLDNVLAEGQTIDMTGSGTDLVFLGSANNGTATGSVTVTYTDGATQSFTISFADWYADTPTSTDQLVDQTSTWDPGPLVPAEGLPTTHPVSVYSTSVPLDPNKTVASVTLPDISPGIGNSQTGMHIFDMAIG